MDHSENIETTPESEPRRRIDPGCLVAFLLVVLTGVLGWVLISKYQGTADRPSAAEESPQPTRRLRRSERIEVEVELRRAREELANMEQAAMLDTQPESRAGWEQALSEARERVAKLEAQLGR